MVLEKILTYFPPLLQATVTTVLLAVAGIALATVVAFAAGLANISRSRLLRGVSRAYIEFFRGTSELVQLYWFTSALPLVFGFKLVPVAVAIIVLGLNLGAYGSEVVRGSILAVPREQYEGATALNFTRMQQLRRVIIPQAVVGMIPPFNNLAIQLLKSTSLVALIGIYDLMGRTLQLRDSTGDTVILFLMVLVIYFALAYVITLLMRSWERRAGAAIGRTPPKRKGVMTEPAVGGSMAREIPA